MSLESGSGFFYSLFLLVFSREQTFQEATRDSSAEVRVKEYELCYQPMSSCFSPTYVDILKETPCSDSQVSRREDELTD